MPCTAPYHIFLSMFYPVGMKHNERVSRILLMYHMAQKSLIPRDSQDNLCICIFSELCHSSVSVLICTESLLRHGRSIRDNEKKHIHVDKFKSSNPTLHCPLFRSLCVYSNLFIYLFEVTFSFNN